MTRWALTSMLLAALGCAGEDSYATSDLGHQTYRLTDLFPDGYSTESVQNGSDIYATFSKDGHLLATLDYKGASKLVTLTLVDIPGDALVTTIPGPPAMKLTLESAGQTLILYRMSQGTPCFPSCTGKRCGQSDGCGGTCQPGSGCCTPSCTGKICGAGNGCGGTCQPGSGCDRLPIGVFDTISNAGVAQGWACDPDHAANSIPVHFYLNGFGTFLGATTANQPNEMAVTSACGGGSAHRFQLQLPLSARGKSVYAYAIDSEGISNPQIGQSPRLYPVPMPVTVDLRPTDDAFVRQRNPSTNYGYWSTLEMRTTDFGSGAHGYLKFNVAVMGTIQSALLRVHSNSAGSIPMSVYKIADTAWSEGTVTYATGSMNATWASLGNNTTSVGWTTIDVTPVVGNGLITFGVTHGGDFVYQLDSDESSFPPVLSVTYLPY